MRIGRKNNHSLHALNDEATFGSFRIDESHLFDIQDDVEQAANDVMSDSSAGTTISEDETLFSTSSFFASDGLHPNLPPSSQKYILDNNYMFVPLKSSSSHSFNQHCVQRNLTTDQSEILSSFSLSNDLSPDTESDVENTSTIKKVRRYRRNNVKDEERSLLSQHDFVNCSQQQLNTSKTFSCMSFRRQSQPCNDQNKITCIGFLLKRSRSGKLVPTEIYLIPQSHSLDHNCSLLTSDWERSANDDSTCQLYGTIFDDAKNEGSTIFGETSDSYVDNQYQDDDTYFFQNWNSGQTSNSLLLRSDEKENSYHSGFEDDYDDAQLSCYNWSNGCETKCRNKNQMKRKLFQQCFKNQHNKYLTKTQNGNNVQTEVEFKRQEDDLLDTELIQQQIYRAYNNFMSLFNEDYAFFEIEKERENEDQKERQKIFWLRLKTEHKKERQTIQTLKKKLKRCDKSSASLNDEEITIKKRRDACVQSFTQRKSSQRKTFICAKDITSEEESEECGKGTGRKSERCADSLQFRRDACEFLDNNLRRTEESTMHVSAETFWMDNFLKDHKKRSKLVDKKPNNCNSKIKRFEKLHRKNVEMNRSQKCFIDEENFFLDTLEHIFLGPDSK